MNQAGSLECDVKRIPFKKFDAFATATSSGNPAAAVYLDSMDDLTNAEMQRIARELKGFVSEVGFVARDFLRLRYFSSEKEVEFCGHATIAIAHDLMKESPDSPGILLHTNKGALRVENRIREEDAVYIQAPEPVYAERTVELSEICLALGIPKLAVDPSISIATLNAGNQTLCVPLKRLEEVLDATPDFHRLQAFCQRHGLDVIAIFTGETADPANRLRTRVFATPFGYLEDPATGSGNAALGYHLHRIGYWNGEPIRIEQNENRENPNIVRLASTPDPVCGIRVIFGGAAVLRVSGHYWL